MNIYQKIYGRLGNNLFCLTTGKYYSELSGANYICIPNDFGEDRDYIMRIYPKFYKDFNFQDINFEKLKSNYFTNFEEKSVKYSEIILPEENVVIDGFRQSPKYWKNKKEFALNLWKPKEGLIEYITELYKEINFKEVISINVRIFDEFDDTGSGTYRKQFNSYLGIEDIEYYYKCIENFPEGQKFLITSNNIEKCKELFKGDNFYFVDKEVPEEPYGHELVELYIQTLCKGNIIPNSTFSWWGAYLNKNAEVVYYPEPFFRYTYDMDIIPDDDKWKSVYSIWEK